jgi:hypothetical protein
VKPRVLHRLETIEFGAAAIGILAVVQTLRDDHRVDFRCKLAVCERFDLLDVTLDEETKTF